MRLLIVGFGYSARHFLGLAGQDYALVSATFRRDGAREGLLERGVVPIDVSHGCDAAFGRAVRDANHILVTAGPGGNGDAFAAFMASESCVRAGTCLVYLSTIGVYGDHQGRWIDEDAALRAVSPRGRLRIGAENAWRRLGVQTGAHVAILRLPGIYGPGRSAFDQLRAGRARRLVKPGQVFNRIHVEDIAHGIGAAFGRHASGIWNIVDDEPAPPQDVIGHAAGMIGMEPPPLQPFETAELTPMARSFYGECKRVSNARAGAALGWSPRYPSYREGLAAIAAAEQREAGGPAG